MKKIFVFAIFVLAHSFCIAAQQPVSPVAEPGNFGEYRADQNTNNAAIQSNFTELYGSVDTLTSALNGKASISCFTNSTTAAACGIDLDWLGTGVGDNLGSATAANISSLFSGTGDCLGSNGQKVACGSGTSFDQAGDYTFTGTLDFSGASVTGLSGGSMVYPSAAGVAVYGGSSAWGTSLSIGTSANNLVQLNGSAQLPAVSAALLTNFPTLNQNTTGTAAGLSGQYIDWSATTGGASIANKPTLGTAAALSYGTSVGNVVRLGDDGSGNAVLPFSLDISDLTDEDGLLGGASTLDDLTDVIIGTPSSGQVLKYNGSSWAPAADSTAAGAGYVSTPPTYSDETCTAGQYAISTSPLRVYNCLGNKWVYTDSTGLVDWSNPTPTAPTIMARSIGTDGTTLTLTGSASLSVGAGGSGGFDVDCTTAGAGITATYSSGAPGTGLVYTLGTTVTGDDTCDLDYTQPGNGIEATNGGADLASITSAAVTNNSTQSGGSIYLGITTDTGIDDGFSAAGEIRISRVQATSTGSVDEFFYYHYGPGNWTGVIYSDNAGEPDTLLSYTASTAARGYEWGWNAAGAALDASESITSGTWYWHGVQVDSTVNMYYRRTGNVQSRSYTTTYGNLPATWPTSSDTDITNLNSGVTSYAH